MDCEGAGGTFVWGGASKADGGESMIEAVVQDLRYAVRMVRRNPGYAMAAVLCLGLGIGVNATVFSFLDGIWFRMLPVEQADRVVSIGRDGEAACGWRDYLEFRDGLRSFRGVAASSARGTFMDAGRDNFEVVVETVSANYADVLRVKARLGRWFVAADEAPGAEPAVVIGARLWERRFHRDPGAIGRSVRIEKHWFRVVGVAPEEFRGISPPVLVDAWLPLVVFPIYRPQLNDPRGRGPGVNLAGRLAEGATVARAGAEMAVIDARLDHAARHPAPMTVSVFRGVPSEVSRRSMRGMAALLLAIVAMVLLIACVNVANLLLSRAAVREREMTLRRWLGATRGRLVRQNLAEGSILAIGGAAAGTLFAYWTDGALSNWLPASIPQSFLRGVSLEMNWRVAAFTTAVALVCGVLFSLAPALESGDRRRRSRQRDVYVVAQVALSLVLLVAAGLLLRAIEHTSHIDPGFATDHRAYIRLFAPDPDFTPENGTRLFTRLLDDARAIPGVREATLSFAVLGFSDGECVAAGPSAAEGHTGINVIEPNYFAMMRVPLLAGRNFAAYDQPKSPRVAIVNETLARQRWPGRNPVGQVVWMGCGAHDPMVAATVIGVAKDSKYGTLDEAPAPLLYVSRLQVWWNGFFALMVRTEGDPRAAAEPLIKLARSGGPDLRMFELRTFDELVELSLWRVRWQATLLGAFGLLAVVLSAIGLYGVVAYSVARRTREIGIRMALGAQKGDVQGMVLARGLRLTAAGIAMGLLLSAAATRLLGTFLYGADPLDPVAFGGAALLWLAIAVPASYIPARRAARVQPIDALKAQ